MGSRITGVRARELLCMCIRNAERWLKGALRRAQEAERKSKSTLRLGCAGAGAELCVELCAVLS